MVFLIPQPPCPSSRDTIYFFFCISEGWTGDNMYSYWSQYSLHTLFFLLHKYIYIYFISTFIPVYFSPKCLENILNGLRKCVKWTLILKMCKNYMGIGAWPIISLNLYLNDRFSKKINFQLEQKRGGGGLAPRLVHLCSMSKHSYCQYVRKEDGELPLSLMGMNSSTIRLEPWYLYAPVLPRTVPGLFTDF